MVKDGYGAGHGGPDPGAVANGNVERDIARVMNNAMISVAQAAGFQVINLTVDKGYPYNINEPVYIANANGVRFAIQNHFNAGGGTGVEVLHYANDANAASQAAAMSRSIADAYGLVNRGSKARSNLGFINQTNMRAFIVEWGFVDAPGNRDVPVIMSDPNKGARAIIGALGGSVPPVAHPKQELGAPKNELNVCGQAHVAGLGWLDRGRDGQNLGTTKFGVPLEAMRFDMSNMNFDGEVEFLITPNIMNESQNKTYTVNKSNPDQIVGTVGKGLRFEGAAFSMVKNTTGKQFYLQFHTAYTGWGPIMELNKNPKYLGSEGKGNAVECFRFWAE